LPKYVHFSPSIPADAKFTKPAYKRTTNSSMLEVHSVSGCSLVVVKRYYYCLRVTSLATVYTQFAKGV